MKRFFPLLSLLFILPSCIGWLDMFLEERQIIGNYYLLEKDSGKYTISYKIDDQGSFIGRTPYSYNVLAYAIKDSFLIMETEDYEKNRYYYVLNMNNDSLYGEPEGCIIDTIKAAAYSSSWVYKLNPQFEKAVK